MKRAFIAILFTALIGCREEVPLVDPLKPEPLAPTEIDGLELTFLKPDLGWYYTSVAFPDESTGYISLYTGSIIKTTDGGVSWTKLNTDNYLPLWDLFFLNTNEGWAATGASTCATPNCTPRGAVLFHTTDAGATWTEVRVQLSKPIVFRSVWFQDSNIGFAVGENLIARTTDGGKTWKETALDLYVSYGVTGQLLAIRLLDSQRGILSADAGRLVRTEDGGETWTITSSPNDEIGYFLVEPVSDQLTYAGGQNGVYSSADFGKSWKVVSTKEMPMASFSFSSANSGFAFGMGNHNNEKDDTYVWGSIFYTADGGKTWTGSLDVHEVSMLVDSSFPSERVGYAISDSEVVKIVLK